MWCYLFVFLSILSSNFICLCVVCWTVDLPVPFLLFREPAERERDEEEWEQDICDELAEMQEAAELEYAKQMENYCKELKLWKEQKLRKVHPLKNQMMALILLCCGNCENRLSWSLNALVCLRMQLAIILRGSASNGWLIFPHTHIIYWSFVSCDDRLMLDRLQKSNLSKWLFHFYYLTVVPSLQAPMFLNHVETSKTT